MGNRTLPTLHEGLPTGGWGALTHQKEVAEDSTTPVLVRYVIDGDYILQDFGDDEVSYLSKDQFDKLAAGEQEAAQGVNLNAWCVVKLE